MVNIDFLSQLIDSMETAVSRLELSLQQNNTAEANKLRTFIFDLNIQIKKLLETQHA